MVKNETYYFIQIPLQGTWNKITKKRSGVKIAGSRKETC